MIVFFSTAEEVTAKYFTIDSPDQKIKALITIDKQVRYSLSYEGKEYLLLSAISMTLLDGVVLGEQVKLIGNYYNDTKEKYKELLLEFAGNYIITFRLFNEGLAYRFSTEFKRDIIVKEERNEYRFNTDFKKFIHIPLLEYLYPFKGNSDKLKPNYSSLPLLLKTPDQVNILIQESAVKAYPQMNVYANPIGKNMLVGEHTPSQDLIDREVTHDYISKTRGNRNFPWRLISFEKELDKIFDNKLISMLCPKGLPNDELWNKSGNLAWNWWDAINLSADDYKVGFHTDTYKCFIDFAAKTGIQYVTIEKGWCNSNNLLKLNPNLNISALLAYAKERKIGLLFSCEYEALNKQMEATMNQFEKWGIAGLNIDLRQLDDDKKADFKGCLSRKAAKMDKHLTFHNPCYQHLEEKRYGRLMRQVTRCNQLASYKVFSASLEKLEVERLIHKQDPVYLKYLANMPVVFDETLPMNSKIATHIIMRMKIGFRG